MRAPAYYDTSWVMARSSESSRAAAATDTEHLYA
jgi:hypothetical protein